MAESAIADNEAALVIPACRQRAFGHEQRRPRDVGIERVAHANAPRLIRPPDQRNVSAKVDEPAADPPSRANARGSIHRIFLGDSAEIERHAGYRE